MAKKFFNGFKYILGLGDQDEDETLEGDGSDRDSQQGSMQQGSNYGVSSPAQSQEPSSFGGFQSSPLFTPSAANKNRVVNIHSNINIKIEVYQPQAFEDALKIVDSLRAKKPAIVNLEALPTDVARKIFDFLNGALYAIDGKAKTISRNIFLMVPSNVEVNGQVASDTQDQSDDLIANTLFNFK